MTSKDIASMMSAFGAKKAEMKALRGEMTRAAVEVCGLTQKAAMSVDVEVFLDGWLVGQGYVQSYRLSANADDAQS
jgi:hypothetical protein